MIVERRIILGTEANPLMVLGRHKIDPEDFDFLLAQQELLNYVKEKADESYTWGYFPELIGKSGYNEYPYCTKLSEQLQKKFINNLRESERNFRLAFIRMATRTPVSEFGGLHIDVDIGIAHKRDPSAPHEKEIVRFLLNPGKHPRILEYTEVDRNALQKMGVNISRTEYRILKLPANIEIKRIEIPPRENNFIWALKFWSSLIPHAGITDDNGHFLIAYGMYADTNQYKL